MNQYRVVYVEPGKPAVEKKIGTKLEDLQETVGGLIECIYAHNDGTILVGNEFKMVVYHDHIDINNEGNKVVMRVFVALTDSKDGKNVLQSGSAESIVL